MNTLLESLKQDLDRFFIDRFFIDKKLKGKNEFLIAAVREYLEKQKTFGEVIRTTRRGRIFKVT